MTDAEIVSLFFARSEQAITALEEKYGAVLWRVARNLLRNEEDAEECVNDCCLAVWNTVPPKKPDPLLPYAARIVRNRALTLLRCRGAEKRSGYLLALDELSELLPDGEDLEARIDARELGRSIDRFLDTLTPENRALFLRRYWYGENAQELAASFGGTENRIHARLFRMRRALKKHLEKEGFTL